MSKNIRHLYLSVVLSLCALSVWSQKKEVIHSPNGKVKVEFYLDDQGRPTYNMSFGEKKIINPSHLGLELKNAADLTRGFKLKTAVSSEFDETWQPVWGEEKEIRNHYNQLMLTLYQDKEDSHLPILFILIKG